MCVVKYKFLNLMQCMVYLFSIVYMIGLAHFDLQLEQGLSQFNIKLVVFVYKVLQILGIELSSFFSHLFQRSLISYHNININVIRPNLNPCSSPEVPSLPH